MNYRKKSFCLVLISVLCLSTFHGCAAKKEVTCPFTGMTWENTLEEIQAAEGELINSYDSIYQGTTYEYSKEYQGMEGTIKYIFDSEDKLMSMAWLYIPESGEDLEHVYELLVEETTSSYGESGFGSQQTGAKGQVWYLDGGNILIAVMSTGVNEAIQYQFFHPEVSSEKPRSDK